MDYDILFMDDKMNKRNTLVLAILIFTGLILRIYHINFKSFSIDETIGSFYAAESLFRVVIMTINDVHPPLFYVLHHFWITWFGMSEPALRSISVFFAVLSIPLIWLLGARLRNHRVGLIAALLLVLSPWHVWLSQNARSNVFVMFLVILSCFFLWQRFSTGKKGYSLAYAIVTLFAIYTHYFAFVIWIAQVLWVLMRPSVHKSWFKEWWLVQLGIAVAYLPWIPFMTSQLLSKTRPMYKQLDLIFIRDLFDSLNPYAAAHSSIMIWAGRLTMVFLLIGAVSYLMNKKTEFKWVMSHRLKSFLVLPVLIMSSLFLLLSFVPIATWLGMLKGEIADNEQIYAEAIKSYHVDQIETLPLSFLYASILGFLLFAIIVSFPYFSDKIKNLLKHEEKKSYREPLGFLIANTLFPILIAGLLSLKSPYMLLRSMSVIMPVYFILIAIGIDRLKRYAVIPLFLILVFTFLSFVQFETWNTKNDWRGAAEWVKDKRQAEEPIILDHLFGKKPFFYYGLDTRIPLRRLQFPDFRKKTNVDVWVLLSYPNDWFICDSMDVYFDRVEERGFEGTSSIDDLIPINQELRVIHYRKKDSLLAE
jgi:4-amino-4-deoxy-L-arabinose transferase-like glycosyltransferase